MKRITFLLLIFLIPNVYGISISVPKETDIYFIPGKTVTTRFDVGNTASRENVFHIALEAGALEKYASLSTDLLTIPALQSGTVELVITFPASLPPGVYPVTIRASEKPRDDVAFSASAGAQSDIFIISPYDDGHLYVPLRAHRHAIEGSSLPINVEVYNIGNKALKSLKTQITLFSDGKPISAPETPPILLLNPLNKVPLSSKIDTSGLKPGPYELQVTIGDITFTQKITLGFPTISVSDEPELIAGEENIFTLPLTLDSWNAPLESAIVEVRVSSLLLAETVETVQPGDNFITFSSKVADAESGNYDGWVKVIWGGKVFRARFTAAVVGNLYSESGRNSFSVAPQKQKAAPMSSDETSSDSTSKFTAFNGIMLLMLVLSFTLFAFLLGRYLGGRRSNYEPPTTPP